jgi:UDP:flavonoid glycosyltransferase YjiC (YdhE family)
MSRFLFTTMPATGHVLPKLPIARELAARGHEVHSYTGAAATLLEDLAGSHRRRSEALQPA